MVTVEGDTGMRKPVLRVAKFTATNIMGLDCINAFRASETLCSLLTNKKEVNALVSRTQSDVCAEFPEVFEDGLGHCTKVKAHVEQKDGFVPVFRKPFPLAFAIHDAVGKELERYVDMGVLTPTDSSVWAAPIVTVKKLRGKIGICADFSTGLNDRIMVDSYPIPRAEDLYQALRLGKTFTKLDLTKAYLQVELDEDSKKILVINTHNRRPSGVPSALAIFQNVMDTMLAGIANVAAYLDDIILTGETDDGHWRTLKLEYGLPIRMVKCAFFKKEVWYLGHILSSKCIRGDPKKTAAIVNMQLPTIISKLRSFFSMCHYCTEFVTKLAEMCSPLNQLLRKDARWNLTGEHAKAVERIKRLLNSSFLLTHCQPAWPIALMTRKAFVKLTVCAEFPRQATIKQLTAELQAELPVTARAIAEATKKYSLLKQVKPFVLSSWPEKCPREELRSYFIKRTELSKSYGCLLWEIKTVIPMKLRSRVLMKLHETHPGRERMLSMARKFCWWTAMNKDIEIKAQSCEGCATAQKNSAKVAINPWQLSDRPWKRIHADFAEPIIGKMYLIVVDAHSKWPEVLHMLRITTELTIESLKTVFARFGFPAVLVLDNGTQFTATEFTIFCAENGIHHVTSATYIAQSNGQVERYIDTFKRALKKSTNDRHPKKDRLREYLMTYRITSHPSTKLTPSEIFLKRRIRTVFDLMFSKGIKNHKEQKKMENSSRGYNKILLSEQFDGQRILRTYENDQLETLYALRFGKTFTKLDLTKAYLQVELDAESKKILRRPSGVPSALVIFQKVMDTMLAGIANVAAYLDDIILTGETDDGHRRTLKLEFGLPIRMEKCVFFEKEVRYLGHIFSSNGIRGDPKKTAAIVNMPLPTIISKLRSFFSMCNYCTEFVTKLAEMCSPLNQLLRKDARWNLTGEHAKAVERIKRLLNSSFLLTHCQPAWPIALAANASNEGIGAVVNHRLRDGTVKVIAHVSKMHNAAQSNYGQIEKQALAHVYRVNSKKGVPQMAACRLTRWAIALMTRKAFVKLTVCAEFPRQATIKQLTAELQAELPVTARAIAEATKKYSLLKQVKPFVLSSWPEKCPREELRSYFIKRTELSKSYGCLLWEIKTVIPMKLRSRVLMKLHETHPGRERMLSMARKFCWWTAMNKDIEIKAQSCEGCATAQKNSAKVAINPWQLSDRPWKRIHADFAEPIIGKMYLIVVDAHSKWPEVLHMLRITTELTIESLKTVFARFGFPAVLVLDNGTQFTR
ncbi:Uncharacterized protein T4C_10689 [Trichinella pseudospiralis]|uniref:RNA-directed DNA polymerase n=2 Tax=Trichinella pseudospiralis TaxID=6337 RepID=A0A0V1JLE1_TRIPS|nr:Uncharacterized protein T4C_10689 [Trichinella pseudospiralis]